MHWERALGRQSVNPAEAAEHLLRRYAIPIEHLSDGSPARRPDLDDTAAAATSTPTTPTATTRSTSLQKMKRERERGKGKERRRKTAAAPTLWACPITPRTPRREEAPSGLSHTLYLSLDRPLRLSLSAVRSLVT